MCSCVLSDDFDFELERDAEPFYDRGAHDLDQREQIVRACAPPALTSQLACAGETSAPPTRRPFSPHASIAGRRSRPAGS